MEPSLLSSAVMEGGRDRKIKLDSSPGVDEAIHGCADEIKKLKEEVRGILKEVGNQPSEQLNLIDALQRLGISYHFEIEIEEAMKQVYDHETIFSFKNLHNVALCFRLLRQQGYNLSSDIFTKFKDDNGDFESSLLDDVRAILSLYEAAHIRYHGEQVLEEALIFTTTNLTSMMKSSTSFSCSPLGRQVKHSLDQPFHKGIPRLEARRYISLYEENDHETWSDYVIKLAKLDFKLLQAVHRKELSHLSRWWKDLDFATKLPFARDRLVECYFWAVGTFFEPSYSLARAFLTKVVSFISVVDDIYDVYGTFEELKLFTDAFERWDVSSINQLPGYMKISYQATLDEFEKMEELMHKQGCSYPMHYAREAMKDLARAYLVEAKWYHERHVPKLDEYSSNGLVSSSYYLLSAASLVGMGKIASMEAFEWLRTAPKPLRASCLIGRLINDIGSHEFEQKRGHVASAVECYMEEYGASEREACREIYKMTEEAWKDINEGCFAPGTTTIPRPLLMPIVNLTRLVFVVYKYEEDTYTHSDTRLKESVALLFVDPIDP
ncbi:hypothetical protein Syun_010360 [Stephania yunnanensis]|uniref:Uncharacterized protein n=1 Tax=Stephania yunnanensis TaxID=152371 RepID=A0AAP0PT67_9MAGN